MWKALLVIFALNFSVAHAATDHMPEPEFMQLRLQGYQLVTELLQSSNPNLELNKLTSALTFEPDKYHIWKSALAGLNDASIDAELDVLFRTMNELAALNADQAPMIPTLLNSVLQAQSRIDDSLHERLLEFDQAGNELSLLDRQLIDIARFGLYYQTRIFSGLMVFSGNADGNLLADLDGKIRRQFTQLSTDRLENREQIERSQRLYEFVSHSMLEGRSGWIPYSSMYYLTRSADALLVVAQY